MKQETRKENKERLREIIEILNQHEAAKGMNPDKLIAILEDLGPTYVKIGQILSTRPDILSPEYRSALEKLRSNVSPMPYEDVCQVVQDGLGAPVEELYKDFDKTPIGAASIGQVHQAHLQDGTRVVVKVRRKGIEEKMSEDMSLLRRAAKVIDRIPMENVIDFGQMLDEMWAVAQEEMNFLTEASHAKEFYRLNSGVEGISSPKVFSELTCPQVMTMEFIDGVSIDNHDAIISQGTDLRELGNRLADNYIKQIIEDGYFHADPHPGNIKVREGEIVWIDLGMMGRLSNHERAAMVDAINAMAAGDVNGLKDAVITLGECHAKINHAKLYNDIDDMLTQFGAGASDLSSIDLGKALEQVTRVANAHQIAMPASLSVLARGLGTIEGVVSSLNPEINLLKIATTRLTGMMMESFDLKKELRKNARSIYNSGRKVLDIPAQLSDVMKMAMQGRLRIGLETDATEDMIKSVTALTNRIVAGLLIAALLIGSSILCTTNMEPKLLGIPALGAVGYIAAVVFGIYVFTKGKNK